jgi:hypothetical protein
MKIAETTKIAGFLFCQSTGTKSTTIKKMRAMSPYQITPSKKGSFPTGVVIGHSGSRLEALNLPMRARKITPSVKAMRKFINEKSMGTLNAFLTMVFTLNLRDLPAVVYGYVIEGRVMEQALNCIGLQKGKRYV